MNFKIKNNSKICRYSDLSFDEVFGDIDPNTSNSKFYLGTVHSVKGRSLDAVILALKRKAGRSKHYLNIFNDGTQANEELRILYVAISRAKKVLVLAVPSEDLEGWHQHFLGAIN